MKYFAYGTVTHIVCLSMHFGYLSTSSTRANPLSLAATYGVSVDFLSCRYLDVSVLCVRFSWSIHSTMDERVRLPCPNGLPHSEIPGLTVI